MFHLRGCFVHDQIPVVLLPGILWIFCVFVLFPELTYSQKDHETTVLALLVLLNIPPKSFKFGHRLGERIDRRKAGKFSKVPCFRMAHLGMEPSKKVLSRDDLFLVSSHAKVWNPTIGLIHASRLSPFLGCISPQMTFVFWSDGRTYI